MNLEVIIPSRNAVNVAACIEAIQQHEPGIGISVVDDEIEPALNTSAIHGLQKKYGFTWIRGKKAFVYGRNCNLGIRSALHIEDEDGDYFPLDDSPPADGVILLNDDAILQSPGGFTAMAQACIDYPEFGLIGGVTDSVGNPNQKPMGIGLRNESRMVCFLCCYIPRTTIDRVGLLCEDFINYGLDDDSYSLRVRRAGLKIGVHDDCRLDHTTLPSSFRTPGGPGGDFRPNMKIFIQKYGVDNWNQPKETSQFAELFP